MALKWLSVAYCIERQGSARATRTTDDTADPAAPNEALIEKLALAAEAEVSAYTAVAYPAETAAGTSSNMMTDLCFSLYVDRAQGRRLLQHVTNTAADARALLERISRGYSVVPEWTTAATGSSGIAHAKQEFQAEGELYDHAFDQADLPGAYYENEVQG